MFKMPSVVTANRAAAGLLVCLPASLLPVGFAYADQTLVTELEARVESLTIQLEDAKARLLDAQARADEAQDQRSTPAAPVDDAFRIGPVTIGGAIRFNYVYGDYARVGDGPQRGSQGGNVELDTFRINLSLNHEQLIGELEYRWYDGYNFLHTGWVGYAFDDRSQIEVGVTRVPFGPGPYGVSQSWFFDQHYYVGLADDMDLGVKYHTELSDWQLDFAYFVSSEGNWNGASEDSARYSFDAVQWQSAIAANGDVVDAPVNGYTERNQLNFRAIYSLEGVGMSTDAGVSMQWGELEGKRADDGHHWALSAHMRNAFGNAVLATQLTRYEMSVDDSGLGNDALVPFGAYDFAWPVATRAWMPAVSLSYRLNTPGIAWLDYVLPYIEYSSIVKDDNDLNNSDLFMLGSAWASGGWYIYSDLAYSNGNLFIGDKGDNYLNVYNGVGDFGVNGNDDWNYRFNVNFGYYY